MKIISKYKDYYDYLVGAKYGIDNKIVLDRREGFSFSEYDLKANIDKFDIHKFAICGNIYECLVNKQGKIYWGEKARPFVKEKRSWWGNNELRVEGKLFHIDPRPTTLNDQLNCPILYMRDSRVCHTDKELIKRSRKFPQLKQTGIASLLPPEEIYIMLYNWMNKTPEIKDNRTDLEKLQSKGFDKRTSFRH